MPEDRMLPAPARLRPEDPALIPPRSTPCRRRANSSDIFGPTPICSVSVARHAVRSVLPANTTRRSVRPHVNSLALTSLHIYVSEKESHSTLSVSLTLFSLLAISLLLQLRSAKQDFFRLSSTLHFAYPCYLAIATWLLTPPASRLC